MLTGAQSRWCCASTPPWKRSTCATAGSCSTCFVNTCTIRRHETCPLCRLAQEPTARTAKRTSELVGGGATPGGSGVSPKTQPLASPPSGVRGPSELSGGPPARLAGDERGDPPQGHDEA